MGKAKGGRGVKADYGETKQVRIPPPLIPQVIELKQRYFDYLDTGGDPETPPDFLQKPINPEAIALLVQGKTPIKQGGFYDPANGSKLRKSVEKALELLQE